MLPATEIRDYLKTNLEPLVNCQLRYKIPNRTIDEQLECILVCVDSYPVVYPPLQVLVGDVTGRVTGIAPLPESDNDADYRITILLEDPDCFPKLTTWLAKRIGDLLDAFEQEGIV